MDPLISASDLADFPGAPFDPVSVYMAGEIIRAEAGWHIAPVITETVTIHSNGSRELLLPSLRVASVATVTGAVTSDWVLYPGSVLYRPGGWPLGLYNITLTHGFAAAPFDLVQIVAARAKSAGSVRDPSITSVSVGQVRTTYDSSATAGVGGAAVNRYSINTRVG